MLFQISTVYSPRLQLLAGGPKVARTSLAAAYQALRGFVVSMTSLPQAFYLVGDETTGRAAVVDPRRDVGEYLDDAAAAGLRVEYVIETHMHADFLSGHLELPAHYALAPSVAAACSRAAAWAAAARSRASRSAAAAWAVAVSAASWAARAACSASASASASAVAWAAWAAAVPSATWRGPWSSG